MHRLGRVLIIGSGGQLGSYLMRTFSDLETVGLEHRDIQIEKETSVASALEQYRPDIVINTAAFHNVDRCEREPAAAFAINAVGVDTVAGMTAKSGAVFVTISTDYVFSGEKHTPYTEEDTPDPLNAYGISKYAGELLTRRHAAPYLIVRTSGLYGVGVSSTKGYTFVNRILQQAEDGERVRVVDDMVFSPSYAFHVTQATRRILEARRFGVYHVAGAGYCSWYEFAKTALEFSRIPADIQPIKYADFGSAVRRPMFSALESHAMKKARIPALPDWKEGLRAFVRERSNQSIALRRQ